MSRRTGNGNSRAEALPDYDVSDLVGFNVHVKNAAQRTVDQNGKEWTEVPNKDEMLAAAAMVRCLMIDKLRGLELRAIRRIVGWTADELAKQLDVRASPDTISRWENDKQQMGGYAEKVFRLNVCEALKDRAPGVGYEASLIARIQVNDPWMVDAGYEVPSVNLEWLPMKIKGRRVPTYMDDLPHDP